MFNLLREKFQLWIYNQAQNGRDIADQQYRPSPAGDIMEYNGPINRRGTRFEVHHAHGGLIIEVDRIDEANSLYIVREDQNLAESISKIITIESLKQ